MQSLAIPLLTSSMTTILAFVPMLLTEGSAGEYVNSLGQVVTILLLASWFLSMTVTPAMCAWFLKVPAPSGGTAAQPVEPRYDGTFYQVYRRILETALRRRWLVVLLLVALFVGSVKMLGTVRKEFFPLGERNQLLVYMDFEAGTDIRESEKGLKTLTTWLSDGEENPEVTSNIGYVGFGGPRFFLALSPPDPDPHRAFVLVNTADPADVDILLDRINRFMDENIPAARGDAKKMWFGGTEPGVVEIRLSGPDGQTLFDKGALIEEAFHQVPGTVGIKQDWENKVLKLQVAVDQTAGQARGRDLQGSCPGPECCLQRHRHQRLSRRGQDHPDRGARRGGRCGFPMSGPAGGCRVYLRQRTGTSRLPWARLRLDQRQFVGSSARIKRKSIKNARSRYEASEHPISASRRAVCSQRLSTRSLEALDLPARLCLGGWWRDRRTRRNANGRLFGFLPHDAFGGIADRC